MPLSREAQAREHDARARRAASNIAKLKRALAHNAAVLKLERIRASRARKTVTGVTGGTRTVRWALSRVGVVERPAFSNSGPFISDWLRMSDGQPGWPWCQAFANAGVFIGTARKVQLKSCYTPQVVDWARNREHGLRIVSSSEAAPGDLVYFKFPGISSDFCDHVGILESKGRGVVNTIEGNTSRGNGGSQNNGGGVFRRSRPLSVVVAIVRPPY